MASAGMDARVKLRRLFDAGIEAADPRRVVPKHLPPKPKGRTVVVGAGKAAASMALAVEEHWSGPLSGVVVTRYGQALPCRSIEVMESSHPVPDAAGAAAAERILAAVGGLGADDLVLALISGGASALMPLPAPGISLADKQQVNQALLRSGAAIDEMNVVRKHLSAIKGGRLAAASYPAEIVSLIISDVPGDDPAIIGSGPTVPDPSTFADARAVLAKYRIEPPETVARRLERASDETPKPGDPSLARARLRLIARPLDALERAAERARDLGLRPLILGDAIEGEAREVARAMAGIALASVRHGHPVAPPAVLLSAGEATVTVRGHGRGGRNTEFLLALALALGGHRQIAAIACGTDGVDGTEDNAGALILPDTLLRAARLGVDAEASLADNDAYSFFKAVGDLVVTGPTLTNVNDFRAILVAPAAI
ncbi:MAG: glycerate kinase [Proteobacteria bacterium]|nr:glycerate kinase [Pseudomonadota bacterium]MBI3497412.1 glycerate kinase [Pseudomonadota bacterium]